MNARVWLAPLLWGTTIVSLLRPGGAAESPPRSSPPPVPPEHPRLYLRAPQVADLPRRLAHPVLAPVVARLEKLAQRSPQFRAEWRALQYLVKPDPAAGRTLVAETLALLQR
ncbi:hypothetical protein LDC_1474, partial [sediment metagenome]